MDFVVAGLAACCACFFTNPLDVLKIRMQLQGELRKNGQHTVYYKNVFHAGYVIVKNDGILALQKGLLPALGVQFVMNGLRLGTYQYGDTRGYTRDKQGNLVFYKNILVSGAGGIFGQFFASPLFMVKTHLQAQATRNIAVGYQHNHEGTWQALIKIYRERGIKGLFRGGVATVPRGFAASTSQLPTFQYAKQLLQKYNICTDSPYIKSFLASMISGIAVSIMITPFDLVLTRIYNQGVDSQGRGLLYNSYIDCVVKIYKMEGLGAFSKGLLPNYIRLGPHTVLCLMFWDLFKEWQQHIY